MKITVFCLDHLNFGASDFGFSISEANEWVGNTNRLVFKLQVIARRFPSICGSLAVVQLAQVR
jgi:hypothetical protein